MDVKHVSSEEIVLVKSKILLGSTVWYRSLVLSTVFYEILMIYEKADTYILIYFHCRGSCHLCANIGCFAINSKLLQYTPNEKNFVVQCCNKGKMQNWSSNFHCFSFQSSNFQFLSIQDFFTTQLVLPLNMLETTPFCSSSFFFFFFFLIFINSKLKEKSGKKKIKGTISSQPLWRSHCQDRRRRFLDDESLWN